MNKNNKIIIAAIAVVALLLVIGALFASGILSGNDDDKNTTSYEVSFIDGDDVIKILNVKENNLVSRISDPEKEGYIFTGWYSDKELTNEFDFENIFITKNTNIYAKWVKASEPEPGDITFTVTFNTDGTSSIASQTVKEGEKAVKPADPLKSGYKFEGWYSDSSFTTKFDFKTPITFDITLYAKFTASQGGGGGGGSITPPPVTDTTFTVTFESNGSTLSSQTVKEGEKVTEPANPDRSKENYTFAGWYSDSSFTTKFDFNSTITDDTTLYAKWAVGTYDQNRSQITITIDPEHIDDLLTSNVDVIELADTNNYENVTTVNISKDLLSDIQKENKAQNPQKPNTFQITTAKGSVQLSSEVVDSIIRKSVDKENISISIENNSDDKKTVYDVSITVTTESGKLESITQFPETITISIPYTLKDGENPQDIVVYYIDDNKKEHLVHGTYNEKTKCVDILTNHLSTYEIRNGAKYSINFILNGGKFESFISNYVGKEFNERITKPADPLKTGYTFKGWFKDKSLTTAWNFDTDTVKTLNESDPYTINLYAKWEAVSYSISYELNEGTNSSGNPISYTIESETITFENPTKTGYTFKGWFSDANFTTQITSIVKGSFENVTLYASWDINKYTITFVNGVGYSFEIDNGDTLVEYGKTFSFSVIPVNSDAKFIVKSNGVALSSDNSGKYKISNVTENQIITVEGISAEEYVITLPTSDAYTITPSSTSPVKSGGSFTFSLELNSGYNSDNMVIKANDAVLTSNDGNYTVNDITSNILITVEGVVKNQYSVTFDYNNGSESIFVNVAHNGKVAKPNDPIRIGYTFNKWLLSESAYDFSTPVTGNITLKADWTASSSNYYVYVYQETLTNGGYSLYSVNLMSGTTDDALNLNDLKHQYNFTGFAYNSEKSISSSDKTIKADGSSIVKLYYDRDSYNLTFIVSHDQDPIARESVKYGMTIYPPVVSIPGYILSGWYSDVTLTTQYTFSTMPASDLTLYAMWTEIFTITYDANGGNGKLPLTVGYIEGTDVYILGPGYPNKNSYLLTKDGCTFDGWEYGDETYKPGMKFTISSKNVTMKAIWLRNAYNITVNDTENGSVSVTETSAAPKSEISITISPNTGYELSSLIVQDSNGQYVTIENGKFIMPADDITISAEFKLIEYKITFIDWDENEIQSETYHYGDTVIPPQKPVRQSDETYRYIFSSWSPEITSVTADATYKAQYISEFIEYTITYQNYDKSVITTQTYHYNDATSAPQEPERTGYAFAGWYSDENLQHEYQFSTMPADNITLYAKWTVNSYNVSFHPNNGNNEITQTFEFNSLITAPAIYKTGYSLDGWYTDFSLQNKFDFESNRMPASNINLYAKWNLETYTITLHNGEETSTVDYDITKDSISLPAVSKTGHDFLGWYELDAETEFVYSKGVTAGDIDLYSKFSVNQYTITFESNGGSSVPAITQDYSTSVSKPNDPMRDGYTFAYWCSDESLQTEYQFSTMPADNITLYAKWTVNSYTLTISYVYEDNSQAYLQHIETLAYGSEYSVESPEISGMLPDKTAVSGTILNDTIVTVIYSDSYAANLNGNNYKELEDALNAAESGDKVILLNDYTLKQNITVKKGVFLVLPCSDEDTGYDLTADYEQQHNPNGTMSDSNPHSVLYRTLTIPEGITVDLQGQLLVNAVTGRAAGGYHVMDITGGYAQIILNGDISVKNEGILEVCGYITGDGKITAESGAEIRDMYIVQHWRGGTQAVSMYGKKVFPFNEYDCHNIQSKLVIYSGASLLGNVKMFEGEISGYHYTRFPQVDNTNGLIRLAEGAYLVKTFDPDALNGSSSSDKGRVTIEIHGGATASQSTLWIVKQNLSSGDYIFPIDGDISFELYDGMYHIDKRFKFLTGSELTLHENANLIISSTALITLYDQFDDLCNISGTKYPDRPSAILTMMDSASLTVEGYFAGILRISGNIGDVQINTDGAKGLTTSINEAGSSSGSVNLNTFTTKIQNRVSLDYGDSQIEHIYVENGQKLSPVDAPEKTGYEFKGWYSDSEFTQVYDLNALVNSNFTLYAKYDRAEFSVTFDSKGGSDVKEEKVLYEGQIKEPQNPSRTGYIFAGWFIDSNCTQTYDFNTPVINSFTLYAGWTLETYSITYELNGGSNHENNPSQYDVENPKVFLVPSKTGHTFVGWYTDAEFNNKITETSGKAEDLTLYANWTINTYTVTLNYVSDDIPNKTINADYNSVLNENDLGMNRLGYTLTGWYRDSSYSTPWNFNEDKVINTYTVTLNYVSDDIPNKTINADYNSVLNENDLGMNRLGYTLTGWYRDSSYSTPWNFNEDKVINNVTLYAKWEAVSYSITYELDEGTNSSDNPVSYTIDTETITLNDPTRLGYKFLGWFEASDFSGSSVTEIAIGSTGNITLYANWEAVEYTVSFVNWDDSEISSKQYHYSDAVTAPINPERPSDDRYSYTFSGWDKEIASVTENATYKAVYTKTPIDYTISYELNGGENNQSNPENYNCETTTITLKDPTRLGYTFKGWFTDEGFENQITEIVKGSTGNITLYASWEIITFSITVPTSSDYKISYVGSTTVNYGSNFEFTITVDKMYDINKVIVKSNGVALTKSNEKYVIENITENQTISVKGIEKNSYNVTIPQGDGFTLTSSSNTVAYGESVTFTFTLDEAYSQSEYTIKQNGSVVTLTNNQFTIESVTSDINITVEGVKKNTYSVTFEYDNESPSTTKTITHGNTVTKPADPTKEGYVFADWTLEGSSYDFNTTVIESITLTANWTPISYQVQFNGNGSTSGEMSNQTFTYDKAQNLTANAFVKTGYTFAGWSDSNTGSKIYDDRASVDNLTTTNNGTVTLYAVWTPKSYTITYDANTGSGSIKTQTATYGSSIILGNGSELSRTGYKLIKWNTQADGNGTDYELNKTFQWNIDNDLNLYAVWEIITYNITYELNEGTNNSGNPASYTVNTETITLKDPVRVGYTFIGWYTTSDFSGNKVTEIVKGSTGNKTLYAQWEQEQYLITFNANGGSPQPPQMRYKVGDDVAISTNLSKNGYNFAGWFTDSACTQPFVYSKGTTTGNITLYAKWTPIGYTITYELNGGTVSGNPGKYTIESETITINNPTKTGYRFSGWTKVDATGSSGPSVDTSIKNGTTGNIHYIANWDPYYYSIQFKGNGETSGTMSIQSFVFGTEQNLNPNKFVKTGYTFVGWSDSKDGEKLYDDEAAMSTNLNITQSNQMVDLYAVWSLNHYTVTLPMNNLDGGIQYTTNVVDGYDASSIEYGKDFQFTITFSESIGGHNPVVSSNGKTFGADSQLENTYTFIITNITSDLNLQLELVNYDPSSALSELAKNNNSPDYNLAFSETTLTVSIINPDADVSDLINKLKIALGEQQIPVNQNSGRESSSSFLSYLPDDESLWKNNVAEYLVSLGGYTIIFKQDTEAIEKAKIQYLTEIEQYCRIVSRNMDTNFCPNIWTSTGIENNNQKFLKISIPDTVLQKSVMQALFDDGLASVLSIVGHPDARYGYYSTELNFDGPDYNLERAPIGNINMDNIGDAARTLLPIALDLLNKLGLENLKSLDDPMSNCFYTDESGNSIGYDGYAKQLCVSNAGIRYTDYYHFLFEHYQQDDAGYVDSSTYHHNLVIDESLVISFKNLGTVMNNNMFRSVYSTPGYDIEALLVEMFEPLCILEYSSMAAGELVVINIDASSGYTMNDIQVTSTSGEIKWYNSNSFIMPDGDVTISLRTSSEAETPTIIESPSSTVNMAVGDSKSLTVSASVSDGGSLSYAWYAADGPSDTTVEETKKVANSATFTIPANQPKGTYYYFCVVTNTLGITSSTSTSSIVTVQITAQTYSISFETNGGSAVDVAAYQNLKQGDALSLPSSEKFGHQFDGWYSDAALSVQAPTTMPANNLTLYAKWNNVLSSDGSVTVFENVGDKPWLYDKQSGAYHSSYAGAPDKYDETTTLPEFSVTLTGPGVLSFDYMLKSNKASADIKQDALCYNFSPTTLYVVYNYYLLGSTEALGGTFAVTDLWSKASVAIDAAEGESVTVYFAYAKLADDSTEEDGLWIKNLNFSLADMHLTVNSNNNEYGNISATSGDQELAVGSENMLPSASSIKLSAVPNAGYKFYCWVDENNNILSTKSTYSFSLANDLSITAVFGSEIETQYVAQIGKNFYTSLETALADAKSGDKLTLLKDYEMTSDATVKSGVFLLLPCMNNDVGYASNGYNPNGTTKSVKSLYRTLTIDKNATLTIEGSVLVNAVTGYPAGGDNDQDVRGGYAQINLDGNIIVNDKGLLDNCGYILGSGQVTAKSGAEIRDLYVVKHWDGGSHANGAYNDGIFPFTEYNCHNIQTTLYMESGASLLGNVKMYASIFFNYTRFPQVDNNNGLIRLAEGAHLIKTYDPEMSNGAANDKGKVSIIIDGGATFSSSTLKILSFSLSTKSYVYPVDGDISFTLNNGNYTVENDFKVLPGCIVTVSGNSTLTTSEGTTVVFYQNTNNDGVNGGKGWDTYVNSSSRYPADRPDAYLQLLASSKFTANGAFAGFIQADGAEIKLNGNTSCITKETISIVGSGTDSDTQFKEITTTAQIQKIVGGHNVIFDFVKDGVTTYSISTTSELPIISIAEYTFDGWYSGESKIESLSAILEDTSLTAKYILKSNNVTN